MADEVLTVSPSQNPDSWVPYYGECINHLSLPSDTIKDEAFQVISRCLPPTMPEGSRTGLVIGYVQSGKTSSFTAVSAFARDNEYQLVIVVSGTSIPLFDQSANRLISSLGTGTLDSGWAVFNTNTLTNRDASNIRTILEEWHDPEDDEKRTCLILAMKNARHLDRIINLLNNPTINLSGVKALIIDDEADQASLNVGVSRNERSAIYSRLVQLRNMLPHVTYLQYTATPQAPLLIRLTDMLSPAFCRVLTAGTGYIGGRQFFVDHSTSLLRSISLEDIESANENTPPESLVQALRVFLLGACAHRLQPRHERTERNRSMMIHPSQLTRDHGSYHDFVVRLIARWKEELSNDASEEEKESLRTGFQQAYADLLQTVGVNCSTGNAGTASLPSFDELMSKLRIVLDRTQPTEINRSDRGAPNIRWDLHAYHILVGGAMLDRGYTVNGLTVTYMPRTGRTGNIDTIQQRARWFGYKESYLGYCRVYLTPETETSYVSIVSHEEAMRQELSTYTGPLTEWKRRFFIEPNLRPTRQQVIGMTTLRGNIAADWFRQKPPRQTDNLSDANWEIVNAYTNTLSFEVENDDPRRQPFQRHMVANGSMRDLVLNLLTRFIMGDDSDGLRMFGLLWQLTSFLSENPDEEAFIVKMSCSPSGVWTPRTRTTSGLHQGANPASGYPGDNRILQEDLLSVQLFSVQPELAHGNSNTAPAIAVHVPERMARAWLTAE